MTRVICHNEFIALHRWPSCPKDHPHSYLASKHRHFFTVETVFDVSHGDRAVEIFEKEDEIKKYIDGNFQKDSDFVYDFEDLSCEMLAQHIAEAMQARSCEVREDGRGGAIYVRE